MKNKFAKVAHSKQDSFIHNGNLVVVEITVYEEPYAETTDNVYFTRVNMFYEGQNKVYNLEEYKTKSELDGLFEEVKTKIAQIFADEISRQQQAKEDSI